MATRRISYDRQKIVAVLRDLEMIVCSLDRIGSAHSTLSKAEYDRLSSEFLDDWRVCPRLAKARRVLGDAFSAKLGPDGKDELEREVEDVKHWTLAKPKP